MSHADISKLSRSRSKKNKLEKKYEYYSVDGKAYRLALYFENERLNAFVRGYQTPTNFKRSPVRKLDFDGSHVLLVDDEPVNLDILWSFSGKRVLPLTAEDGYQALALARKTCMTLF